MDEVELIMIRHGETELNSRGVFAGRTDCSLTEESRKVIRDMVKAYPYPRVDVLFRSPLIRCLQTLELVYPDRKNEAVVIPELREMDFGDAEGQPVNTALPPKDLRAFVNRVPEYCFPNGEKIGDAFDRVRRGIDKIMEFARVQKFCSAALFTHSVFIDLALGSCVEEKMTIEAMYCPNGYGISVKGSPEAWQKGTNLNFCRFLPEGIKRPTLAESSYGAAYSH
jgi:alpha-ribazole phosphatase